LKAWLVQHATAAKSALLAAWSNPAEFLFNALAIAIVAALPVVGLTVLEGLRPISEKIAVAPEVTIFLAPELSREKAKGLAAPVRKLVEDHGMRGELSFVGREQALASLRGKTNLADAVTVLGSNPLPDAYVLTLQGWQQAADATPIQSLAAQLKSLPGVDFVQADSTWMRRLAGMVSLANTALLLLAAMLSIVIMAVVFNTIRLQALSRRDEIRICGMLGATQAYLCRPFYYRGALLGLVAGLLALAFACLVMIPMNAGISDLAALYGTDFRLGGLGIPAVLAVIGTCAALGWMGAMLPVRRMMAGSRHPGDL
jgi:cell division transport system permease protein